MRALPIPSCPRSFTSITRGAAPLFVLSHESLKLRGDGVSGNRLLGSELDTVPVGSGLEPSDVVGQLVAFLQEHGHPFFPRVRRPGERGRVDAEAEERARS